MIERLYDLAPYEPRLLVGAGPTGLEDVQRLAREGVTGLLSLQTDDDLGGRGLRWPTLWHLYLAHGITAARVPIQDFDPRDLTRQLEAALEALDALLLADRRVYLHCTAGLNRSPTIALAHLSRTLGLERAQAVLRECHPDAMPHSDALARWSKRHR